MLNLCAHCILAHLYRSNFYLNLCAHSQMVMGETFEELVIMGLLEDEH